jgi:hypothetical protein
MGKFTISADTLEELLDAVEQMLNVSSVGPAPAAAGEAPKRQSRKKAEAPAPIQPEPAAGGNPFGAAPAAEPANPFAAAPGAAPAGPTFAPGAADPHANFTAERPAVTKFKELLSKIASQHGEPAVYGWAIKAFGLSPSVTKDEFLSKLIHDQSDDALALAYKQGGGQP